jgi:hypothetical protein
LTQLTNGAFALSAADGSTIVNAFSKQLLNTAMLSPFPEAPTVSASTTLSVSDTTYR